MQMRYRYRIEPTSAQQEMLARVFGCCRVVFNDALRVRDEAYGARVKLSDSEIQRCVITAAKTTTERAWLCEVPSVALVQSVNDSRRAWRNFFDSTSGKRRGRRVGRPRFKSRKDHRQSFRLTRNGFSLKANGRLFVAKVGEVRVRWSRELPSTPSSVTIIREPDGHFYASFVVDVGASPLPVVDREVGVDVGSLGWPRPPPPMAVGPMSSIRSIWVASCGSCGGWSGRSLDGRKDRPAGTSRGAR
ncbi:hypothetical protein MPRG_64200 [Mycobacterium paragordonae]|uniref:Transposase putative helix-turn-helix domain-containing protein n=1 Tax=Mycobacterium paragordonae TaxID=1389713 RepID=A0ABQ1CFC9_9MYCO|nr:hypothetical protein MPRG_64200 [Mycobacterium paragordonae]